MTKITVSQGDYGYNLSFTVQDSDSVAYNLSPYTVKLKVWVSGDPGTLIIDGTCDIDDAPNGTCHYAVEQGKFSSVTRYHAEIELTKAGAIESTENFAIIVEESG